MQMTDSNNKVLIIRVLLIAISVLMIVIGAYRGEVAVVLQKAVHICLECIGVG